LSDGERFSYSRVIQTDAHTPDNSRTRSWSRIDNASRPEQASPLMSLVHQPTTKQIPTLPMGEQPLVAGVSAGPVVADTFAGRIHVKWDNSAQVTPLGQLPFFIEYLKQGGLFDDWVADCPLHWAED